MDVSFIKPLINLSTELIRVEDKKHGVRYTTQTALVRELDTIRLMQQGHRAVKAIAHPEVIEHHLEQTQLNSGQRQAVTTTLTTSDQFVAWQGVAGAGKTFALNELKAFAEARGYIFKGFAPSAKAARVLENETKSSSVTVAQLLNSQLPKDIESNQIWVVDEAGLLSAKDAHALLKRASTERARVILVGDTRQLSAVEAGNPFKSLQQAGILTAYLNESQRQKNSPALKIAVDLLAEGRVEDGFSKLVTNGSIQTVTQETKIEKIVAAYVSLTPAQRYQTLLLAGTHEERKKITKALRDALLAEGSLGSDVQLTQLKVKNLSEAEKEYTSAFAIGDCVMPLRDYKRKQLTKGEVYEIVGKTADKLQLQAADGTFKQVNLDFKKAVYEREQIAVAVGDRLMWKKNNQSLEQVNGEEVVVKAINGSLIDIEQHNGLTRTIDLDKPHHLDHAIVRTTYSSQGETADRVLIAADSTIGKESFYVAASRARHELCFYTENPKALLRWALESKAQENPLELIRQQVKNGIQALPLVREQMTASSVAQNQLSTGVAIASRPLSSSIAVSPSVEEPVASSQQPAPPIKKQKTPAVAFWTPSNASDAPVHIEPKHWHELVEGSAIHPDLAQCNVQSVAGKGVYERLLSTRLSKIGGSGQYVTVPAAKLMRAYEQVAEGGWWAKAGIDARSLTDLKLGEQPDQKLWGSFKADNPRVDAEKSQRKGKTEYIKYEHPLGEERQLFLFAVPATLAERIYNLHGIQPTEAQKQSGFWHVVHKYNLPITITEGAKKTLSSLSQGEITIGLSGVNGGYLTKDQDKNRLEQRLLHPELLVFATPGREFRLAFDQDTKLSTVFNVRRELVRTGELLELSGCTVRVVQWQGDKGLDDLIVNQSPLAYAQAQANAIPLAWEAKKHYRSEYTRYAKQVRTTQPGLPNEAVDVEVYKLALIKGDKRDGASTARHK